MITRNQIITVIAIVIYIGLVALAFHFNSIVKHDEMEECILNTKTLMGDTEYHYPRGPTITTHYYNTSYICGDQIKSRVEKINS